jgi:predicted deacetylase
MRRSLCVVLHDVANATMGDCARLIDAIGDVAQVPITLLAVPRYHCEPNPTAFGHWLRERSFVGDEIALHGYTHVDDGEPRNFIDHLRRRHYTRGEGEFSDLSLTEAMSRITAGVRWFGSHGLSAQGFVAPAWLMSRGTWEALRWAGLRYTCTLRRLVVLPDRQHITSQSVVYSTASAWRRQASLGWNTAVAAMLKSNPLLRIELHPHDADHPAIRRSWQTILARELADRHPMTLGSVAEQFRIETDWDALAEVPDLELNHDQEERGGDKRDARPDDDIARVMKPEHHA